MPYYLQENIVIKYFTVTNFRSLKHENILEFDAHLEGSTYFAHPVIGVAGANANMRQLKL
jgi:AAA15 family ATPase/GTPase